MTTQTVTPRRSPVTPERDSFWYLVHAEWTKFRTVRGWVIAVLVTIPVIIAFAFLGANVSGGCAGGNAVSSGPSVVGCPAQPTGPGGEPVQDAFYFAHQPVTGNGTITVQVTSLTGQVLVGPNQTAPGGLQPWSKAGIIIKENTSQGSAYAAMMVTGSNGVRMQWDYVNDTPGLTGSVSASAPRWLRLVRDGGTITGYDSADGTHWTLVGTATLPGLTSTVQAGLFAAGSGRHLQHPGHGRLPPHRALLARYRMDGHQRRRRRNAACQCPARSARAPARSPWPVSATSAPPPGTCTAVNPSSGRWPGRSSG